jgi:hypothetical protein
VAKNPIEHLRRRMLRRNRQRHVGKGLLQIGDKAKQLFIVCQLRPKI